MGRTTTLDSARQLVLMLRQQSAEPDKLTGEEAVAGWRVEAADHGDHRLMRDIDAYDPALLAELWDRPGEWVEREPTWVVRIKNSHASCGDALVGSPRVALGQLFQCLGYAGLGLVVCEDKGAIVFELNAPDLGNGIDHKHWAITTAARMRSNGFEAVADVAIGCPNWDDMQPPEPERRG